MYAWKLFPSNFMWTCVDMSDYKEGIVGVENPNPNIKTD